MRALRSSVGRRLMLGSRQASRCAAPPPHTSTRGMAGRRATQATAAVELPPAPARAAADSGSSLYNDPALYDEMFSYRDFGAEVSFLVAAYRQHCSGAELRSVLDLGCGTARHSILLAKQLAKEGASGSRAAITALDANPSMLAYARHRAQAAGVELELVQGDLTYLALEGREARVDLALCLLGTLSHVHTNATAAEVFRRVARHLRPGGMFVLELAHPGDLFDGTLMMGDAGVEMWEVERNGGRKLQVQWGAETDDFDPVLQVLTRTVVAREVDAAGEALGAALCEDVVAYRQFTLREVELLGMLAGLQVVDTYGDLRAGVGIDHEDAYRMVVCLQKQ